MRMRIVRVQEAEMEAILCISCSRGCCLLGFDGGMHYWCGHHSRKQRHSKAQPYKQLSYAAAISRFSFQLMLPFRSRNPYSFPQNQGRH